MLELNRSIDSLLKRIAGGNMKFLRWASVALLLMATTSNTGQAQQDLQKQIVSLVAPYIDSGTLVGVSIGVIKDGDVLEIHLGSTGDPKVSTPDSNTIYEIGSVSKVFTGILLGDAIARGEVERNQLAQELLPENVTMPSGKKRSVTLIDLSTHRSGLPRLPDNMTNPNGEEPYRDYDSKLAYEFLNRFKLKREPQALQEYSNFGVGLLGHLLCRKAGLSYEELLADRITGPLGMRDTFVTVPESAKPRFAVPHTVDGVKTSTWDFADMPGAGGIRSTTNDMLTFSKACLRSSDTPTGQAMETAWKEYYSGGLTEIRMGLGWHFGVDRSTHWHNGQTGGFHTMFLVDRKTQKALTVMSNTGSRDVDRLAMDIDKLLQGKTVEPRTFPVYIEVPVEKMERFVGKYELAPKLIFTVSVVDRKLMVGLTGQATHQVFAESDLKWRYKVVEASLTFDLTAQGNATSVELFQNGVRQKAKRVEE